MTGKRPKSRKEVEERAAARFRVPVRKLLRSLRQEGHPLCFAAADEITRLLAKGARCCIAVDLSRAELTALLGAVVEVTSDSDDSFTKWHAKTGAPRKAWNALLRAENKLIHANLQLAAKAEA